MPVVRQDGPGLFDAKRLDGDGSLHVVPNHGLTSDHFRQVHPEIATIHVGGGFTGNPLVAFGINDAVLVYQ